MLIDAPPTLLNAIIHKKHLSHFMAKSMNELAHKSPLICNIIDRMLSSAFRSIWAGRRQKLQLCLLIFLHRITNFLALAYRHITIQL